MSKETLTAGKAFAAAPTLQPPAKRSASLARGQLALGAREGWEASHLLVEHHRGPRGERRVRRRRRFKVAPHPRRLGRYHSKRIDRRQRARRLEALVLLLQDDLLHELCAAGPVAASAAAVSAGAHVSHPARGSDRGVFTRGIAAARWCWFPHVDLHYLGGCRSWSARFLKLWDLRCCPATWACRRSAFKDAAGAAPD